LGLKRILLALLTLADS